MTREELARLLEQFAIVVLQAYQTDISVEDQYSVIAGSIDTIVETVMFCSDKSRVANPSIN